MKAPMFRDKAVIAKTVAGIPFTEMLVPK